MPNLDDPEYWKALINNGLSKFYVLKILYEGPLHGYGILKELSALTGGCCIPTVGTIYPVLKTLTKDGYAKVSDDKNTGGNRPRKIYVLTPKGKQTYKIALEVWRSVIPYIDKAIDFEYSDGKRDVERAGCSDPRKSSRRAKRTLRRESCRKR